MAMKRPPRIGRALLAMLLPHATREGVLQDLDELWLDRLLEAGATRARLWYWAQVVRAVGPCVAHRWQGESSARTSVRRVREGGMMIETVKQDVAFVLKQLRRHPGIGFIVVTTLALGIGATTAIFSVVHSVLLTPLPYENPSELVMITSEMGGSPDIKYLAGWRAKDIRNGSDTHSPALRGAPSRGAKRPDIAFIYQFCPAWGIPSNRSAPRASVLLQPAGPTFRVGPASFVRAPL